MTKKTFKESFNKTWLFETPMSTGVSGTNPYNDLMATIKSNIEAGHAPVELANGLKKLDTGVDIFYWIDDEIVSEFKQMPAGLFIELTGKRPGSAVYASKFYEMILSDAKRIIFSGDILSDEGFGIWKQLFNKGKKLFVYNTDNAFDRATIDSEEDLKKYFGNTPEFRKYRYVLSENIKQHSPVSTSFDLLRTYYLTFNLKDLE